MRAPIVRQGMLAGLCAFAISSCSYPHAGPELPPGATSAVEEAPVNPPPVLANQHQLPAASSSYPTGHPSLRPSTANSRKTPPPPSPASSKTQVSDVNPSPENPAQNATPDSLEPAVPTATLPMATPFAQQPGATAGTDIGSTFDNLEITDDSLKAKLGITRVGSQPSANDLLSVFAGLKNRTGQPLALEVQTLYKDKDGNPLNAGSWIPMTLKPHEETEYRSTSISADAVDFLVRVRRAPDKDAAGAN